ncbi:MAG: hypothetical protein JRE40_10915 [Deltaproteobacteria bacterium]|nr:hypothetical protein [Deltaproteobacteria bacterium]
MKAVRKIIEIDEDLCDGRGQCIPGCAEGALQIIEGKARAVALRTATATASAPAWGNAPPAH